MNSMSGFLKYFIRKSSNRPAPSRSLVLQISLLLLILVFAASSLAQVSTKVDTTDDGNMVFYYQDPDGGELSVEEKIAALNARLVENQADGKAWNDLGTIYAQQGDFELARDSFIKAVQSDATQGDFHRNLGLSFSRLDMPDMAISEFQAYRSMDAMGGRDYWRLIGGAQKRAGLRDEAHTTFQEGLAVLSNPLGAEGLRLVVVLNQMYAEDKNENAVRELLTTHVAGAQEYLQAVEEGDDGYMEAKGIVHNRVAQMVEDGKVLESSGMFANAAELFEEAYGLVPDRDDLLPRVVDMYLAADESLKARVTARRARERHPQKAGTWIATGRVHEKEMRLDKAVEAYQEAFKIDPSIQDLRVAIGNLLIRLGRDKEASTFLRAGVSEVGAKPEVIYNYAVSLIREKKYNAAVASLRTVVRDRPDMYAAQSALAQCLRATKQYSAAIAPYKIAMEMRPEAKTAYNLGYCSMKAKNHTAAVAAYEQALVMDPNFKEARYNLSLTLMDLKRYEDAIVSFDALLLMEPDSYRVYYSQGLCHYYLGHHDDALERYDMAFEQKETVNVLNNIGLVYAAMGNKKEAAAYYEEAKQLKKGK